MKNIIHIIRRFAFQLLGREMMSINIKNGDWVNHPGWRHGPVKVIDQNRALCAVAIQLGKNGGIVVWPMRKDMKIADEPQSVGLGTAVVGGFLESYKKMKNGR